MKNLIKKILREQEEIKGVSHYDYNHETRTHDKIDNTMPQSIFFKAVRYLVEGNSEKELDDLAHSDVWERWLVLEQFLKLMGITDGKGVDAISAAGLPSKIIWAAVDNYGGIKNGSIESTDQLELRPLKEYKVKMYENAVEHVSYYWEPTITGYDQHDIEGEIYNEDKGSYDYWEWDGEPGFEKEYGDVDSDGKEIESIEEIGKKAENLNEVESPEENDLIDKLRKIMKQWKKEDKENEWYDKIENALKELHIPLKD